MADENEPERENLSTVGSGGVDALFEDIESTVETLGGFSDEVEDVRQRITANEGETSSHVRDRINDDVDQLADEVEEASERLREQLQELKRSV